MIKYKIDFKSLSYSILSKNFSSFSFYLKEYIIFYNIINTEDEKLSTEEKNIKDNLKTILNRIENIFTNCFIDMNNKITFIINNILIFK